MSYVADTFASCLTHAFPSEGDIADDSSNLYVNPLGGSASGASAASAASGEYKGVRKSASGDGSVLCAKGSQGDGSPGSSRGSLAGTRLDASRTSLPQPLEEAAAPPPPEPSDAKPKHRKARFQQVSP